MFYMMCVHYVIYVYKTFKPVNNGGSTLKKTNLWILLICGALFAVNYLVN